MGLFDIIDDIAEKQITKTETGDNRIFGVVVGTVAQNYSATMPGRVCVTVPTRDEMANELKWARVAMPSSGSKWGHYFIPEVGDQVLLAFEQGNIEKPYVIGCVPKDRDKILTKSAEANNKYKKIMTRNGSTICFEDSEDGLTDKIRMFTPGESHKIELDDMNKSICISDKSEKNIIELRTETGNMTIRADKKLTIEVGENIELTLNGYNGGVKIKASKLEIDVTGNMELASTGVSKVQGGTVSVEANSMLKLSSGGVVDVTGVPIKLG